MSKHLLISVISLFLLSGCPNLLQEGINRMPVVYDPFETQVRIVRIIITDECIRQMIDRDDVLGVVREDNSDSNYLIETKLGVVKLTTFKQSYDLNNPETELFITKYLINALSRDIYHEEKEKTEKYLERILSDVINRCGAKDS